MRIRSACDRDIPLLPAIERAAAQLFLDYAADLGLAAAALEATTPLEALSRGREEGLLWVAVDAGDRPLGFALARELDGQLHLEEMDVLPAHTRRGLGTALVDQVWRAARVRGCAVTLSTFRGVPWNAPFYSKLGFRELKQEELTAGLLQIREDERRRGLHPALRVLMRRER